MPVNKRIVVGENMSRVQAAAKLYQAGYYMVVKTQFFRRVTASSAFLNAMAFSPRPKE